MKHLLPFLALTLNACLNQEEADPDPFPEDILTVAELTGQWKSTGQWRYEASPEWQADPPVRDFYLTITAEQPHMYVWQLGEFCFEQGFVFDGLVMEPTGVRGTCYGQIGERYSPEIEWYGNDLAVRVSSIQKQFIRMTFYNELTP